MAKGWPDLTLVRERDRRLLFAELKAERGVLSEDQERVVELLRVLETPPGGCGGWPLGLHEGETRDTERRHRCCPVVITVVVWRPRDMDAGVVEAVLR